MRVHPPWHHWQQLLLKSVTTSADLPENNTETINIIARRQKKVNVFLCRFSRLLWLGLLHLDAPIGQRKESVCMASQKILKEGKNGWFKSVEATSPSPEVTTTGNYVL
ncbi:hypothetical protein AMECASPLE_030330 [Ameca splendens]|uniref:Uncharacterized protein n=1 Tax=Ameca splendens TaxID=208324 RepID=A0ABV1ACX9_9TELE